jgi:hypothetical protein
VGEFCPEEIHERDDFVAAIDSQCAARAEVILKVDDDQGVRGLDFHGIYISVLPGSNARGDQLRNLADAEWPVDLRDE